MAMLARTQLETADKRVLLEKTIINQAYGSISDLAHQFNISRRTVSKVSSAVNEVLDGMVAENTKANYFVRVDVDECQLKRSIVSLAMDGRDSIRSIEDEIAVIYPGMTRSYGYIQNVLTKAQLNSREFNRSVDLSSIKNATTDEMFSQGDPILAGIDLDFGYLFSLSHEVHRDGPTWARVLNVAKSQGMDPDLVVKDGGTGMASGVSEVFHDAEQRDDVFHALYESYKALSKLESKAYDHIGREAIAYDNIFKSLAYHREWLFELYINEREKCDYAIEKYTCAEKALQCLHAAISSVNLKTGQLQTQKSAQYLLKDAVELFRDTGNADCLKVAVYLENRLVGLTLATKALHEKLTDLFDQYSETSVSLACRFFERLRVLKDANRWQSQTLTCELLGTYGSLIKQIREEKTLEVLGIVEDLIIHRHRASSAIEGFNGVLRAYLYPRKGCNQGFLDLFEAWHNLHKRRWGRHKGTSAYESLTGVVVTDWLTVLGFPPSPKLH